MFYEHAEVHEKLPEDSPFSVGIEMPGNKMVLAWGDKRLHVNAEQMVTIVTALMMTVEQWERNEISRNN